MWYCNICNMKYIKIMFIFLYDFKYVFTYIKGTRSLKKFSLNKL